MKFVKVPLNRWVIGIAVGVGLIFGNDAIVALIRPFVEAMSLYLPAA